MRMCKRRLCSKQRLIMSLILCGIILCGIISVYREKIYTLRKEIYRNMNTESDVEEWVNNKYSACDSHFTGYGSQFAVLQDIVLTPGDKHFYIPCQDLGSLKYDFDFGKEGTHLNSWITEIRPLRKELLPNMKKCLHKDVMVAVQRYEYANLYHTMTDWYNVYLITKLLKIDVDKIGIVLYDNHSRGYMDDTWGTLFGEIYKVPLLKEPVVVKKLIWNILGYESPVNYHGLHKLPYVKSFHEFFLRKHGIEDVKSLDCEHISVFFLWRRDYVAHPSNPSGEISRKIANEDELKESVRKQFPKAVVHGDNLDRLSFQDQVKLVAKTDILISMHGAGLSHILLLPQHSAVLELFPLYWMKFPMMTHFEAMARWRGVKYTSWQNLNPTNEIAHFKTFIPAPALVERVLHLYEQICPNTQR